MSGTGGQPATHGDGTDAVGPSPVLELRDLTKTFGRTRALRGVDVAFAPGRIHALVGENGAGKSTLLSIIAGFVAADPPSSARVGGTAIDLADHSPARARSLGISIVPQELEVIESMSVAENIFLGREPRRGPFLRRTEMHRHAAELLGRLGTSLDTHAPVERLSVAQLQLVEIAKALANDSRFLALDEPSAVLAGAELELLFEVIHRLAADGVAIAYVSHRLDEIFEHADELSVLKDGEMTARGPVSDFTRGSLVGAMVGREVSDTFPPRTSQPGDVRLHVEGLSVAGKLDDISLDVRAGEIVGLAGLIGSGRTTLAKAIFGAILATGRLDVNGHIGPFGSPRAALDAGLAYLPEDRRREGLATTKPVATNLSLLALGALAAGPTPLISRRAEQELVARLVEQLGIRTAPDGSDLAGQLSGGNQQKVVLGKWLAAHPSVLLLDEPTRGIDVGAKEEIYRILRELSGSGLAILVISSELIEVLGLADRVLVMAEGRIRGELAGAEASEESIMALATSAPGPGMAA